MPGLRYRVESATVLTPEGPSEVGRLVLLGESDRQVRDFYHDRADDEERSEREDAADWLREYLKDKGEVVAADVWKAAAEAGVSKRTLQRSRKRAGVKAERRGFPSRTVWHFPGGAA